MKVYVVKAPYGEYEGYQEPIDKVFIDKKKAKQYVKDKNSKLPLEQANMCYKCRFKWDNCTIKDKPKPQCCDWDEYRNCRGYFKYHDIQALFMEEYEVEE